MSRRWPLAWPRLGLAVAWGSVGVSVLAAPWLRHAPEAVLLLPWIASGLVLGLPHGALDPWVPFRLGSARPTLVRVLAFCTAYLALGGAVVVLWLAAPEAAALGFIALTWAHWGQGDVYALRAMGWDRHLQTRAGLLLAGAVRGALPMGVPLAAEPEAYAQTLGGLAGALDPARGAAVEVAVAGWGGAATWGLLALLGVHVSLSLATGSAGSRRTLALDLGEVAALALFFVVLPPLWSVGVYFCTWHALRHLARLEPLVAPGRPGRLALFAAPATLGALALIAILAWTAASGEAISVYLVGIAALTVPHVAVVTWMDVRQGVWRPLAPEARAAPRVPAER